MAGSNWLFGLANGLSQSSGLLGQALAGSNMFGSPGASPGTQTNWWGGHDNANTGYGQVGQEGTAGVRQEQLAPIAGASMGQQQHVGLLSPGVNPNTVPGGLLDPDQQATGLLGIPRQPPSPAATAQAATDGWGGWGSGWGQMTPAQRFNMAQAALQPRRFW